MWRIEGVRGVSLIVRGGRLPVERTRGDIHAYGDGAHCEDGVGDLAVYEAVIEGLM